MWLVNLVIFIQWKQSRLLFLELVSPFHHCEIKPLRLRGFSKQYYTIVLIVVISCDHRHKCIYIFTSISLLSSSLFSFPLKNSTSPWSMGGGFWLCSVSAGVSSAGKTNCNFWSPLVFPLNKLWNSLLIRCFFLLRCVFVNDLSKETPQTIQGNAIRKVDTRASMFSTRFYLLLIFYVWNKRWCNTDYSAADDIWQLLKWIS